MCDIAIVDQPHLPAAIGSQLRLQETHQVGIGHRRQRMIPHPAIREQDVADEEMSLEHSAIVIRKSWNNDAEVAIQLVHQSFDDRADIAMQCRVKRRTNFEINLAGALPA